MSMIQVQLEILIKQPRSYGMMMMMMMVKGEGTMR